MADPRDYVEPTRIGTPLRDAAVTPSAVDFLAPSNAGAVGELGNPHGPSVISPGLHGDESVRTIAPGPVSPVKATQDAAELASLRAAQPTTLKPFVTAPVPTITGTATVGQTLTAVPGTWSPAAGFTYQWRRDGVAVAGAIAATYVLVAGDATKKMTVVVTGSSAGFAATSKTSVATAAVAAA